MTQIENLKEEHLNAVYEELANLIGIEMTVEIFNTYKGQQITFPTRLLSKKYVRQRIEVEYDGKNLKELAIKYKYSERWIREIIKKFKGEMKNVL